MQGDVGGHVDLFGQDLQDPREHRLPLGGLQLQVRRDGREVADVVARGQPQAAFDRPLLDVAEPLRLLELRAGPLHPAVRGRPVRRRNTVVREEGGADGAYGTFDGIVGQVDRPAERGEDPVRLQQGGGPRPPARRVRPVQRRGGEDQVVGLHGLQVLEGGPDRDHPRRGVPAKLAQHFGVGVGGGDGDPPGGEGACGLAGPGADLQRRPDRAARVGQHPVDEFRRVAGPEAFVPRRDRSEAQPASHHAGSLTQVHRRPHGGPGLTTS